MTGIHRRCGCELHPDCHHPTFANDSACSNPAEADGLCKDCRKTRQAVQIEIAKRKLAEEGQQSS